VWQVQFASGVNEQEMLRYAAAVERYSEHSVAHAIVSYAEEQQQPIATCGDRFNATAGLGVAAVRGQPVLLGSATGWCSPAFCWMSRCRRGHTRWSTGG